MNWKEYCEKFDHIREDFNAQSYEERVRVSKFMNREAIAELIRSKKHLEKALSEIDKRIEEIERQFEYNS